ncbi:MAG: S1C family serine protease [Nitrososphaerales archaeon]
MINASEFEGQLTQSIERLSESVVSIDSTKLARSMRYGVVPLEGQGSGVIIDPKGYIITNNHVVDDAARVQIHLKDGRTFDGEVAGFDPATDVALIKVRTKQDLPAATLGDSDALKVGQFALAIGNTLGLPGGPSASVGVIGALGRPLPWAEFIFEGFIQTDAAINPGNSGGPLADINGNVIGINTAIIPFAQGVGFAIPINTVKRVTEQIFEKGRVIRPWLGISGVDLNAAVARRYNLPLETGVMIVGLDQRGPAYETGLRAGDVIIDVEQFHIGKMKDILLALSKLAIGSVIKITVIRHGSKYATSLRLVESPIRYEMIES